MLKKTEYLMKIAILLNISLASLDLWQFYFFTLPWLYPQSVEQKSSKCWLSDELSHFQQVCSHAAFRFLGFLGLWLMIFSSISLIYFVYFTYFSTILVTKNLLPWNSPLASQSFAHMILPKSSPISKKSLK